MNVLVTFASHRDNARGIAEAIAAELESGGHRTVFADVSRVRSLAGFDAVVVGSGLYRDTWLPQTLAFLDRFRAQLATMPVWLFCSGSAGDRRSGLPLDLGSRQRGMCLMGHRCFPASLVAVPVGTRATLVPRPGPRLAREFRDWDAVSEWVHEIGGRRVPPRAASAGVPLRT